LHFVAVVFARKHPDDKEEEECYYFSLHEFSV
jgi:hypothetical protein